MMADSFQIPRRFLIGGLLLFCHSRHCCNAWLLVPSRRVVSCSAATAPLDARRRSTNGVYRDDDADDDNDDPWVNPNEEQQSYDNSSNRRRKNKSANADDSNSDYYWENESVRKDEQEQRQRQQQQQPQNDYEDDPWSTTTDTTTTTEALQKDVFTWETCATDAGTAHILLPPPSVELPTTVIHFTGGTFFGSAPTIWYRQLLEDIVRHTQAAVVATSIPVTLLQSPLQHVALARKIQRQFQVAWRDVLLDEYGEALVTAKVPVCGMGHSLGARLLVVLATLGEPTSSTTTTRRSVTILPPVYKAFILISFTNYGAAAGIPGVNELSKSSRRVERETAAAATTAKPDDDNVRSSSSRRRRLDDNDDDYDDDEEDWGEIFSDLKNSVREQALKVKQALTPSSRELEFYPTPEQLWKALADDQRYRIPKTLIVQFDADEIDQSVKITQAIKMASDVKFARLRGTHLTPVSAQSDGSSTTTSTFMTGGDGGGPSAWLEQINVRAGRVLRKLLSTKRQARANNEAIRELRQSIARYITEIVRKD